MKRKIFHIFALAVCLLAAVSCVKEQMPAGISVSSDGILTFDFGSTESVQVETKSSVDHKYEMQVHNFYLFVFDASGAKVVGQYFDSDNQKSSNSDLQNTYDNCWYVSNATDNDYSKSTGKTTGTVRLKISSGTDMRIYMLANLDADMVKISSDLLSANIATEQDLLNFGVYMNQTIVTRNGYFPMYGVLKGVTIDSKTETISGATQTVYKLEDGDGNATLKLKRLDAKVRFVFKKGTRPDAKGQTCESFEPLSWQVCNVPRTAYAMGYEERGITDTCGEDYVSATSDYSKYSDYAAEFFDTEPLTFEEYTSSTESAFTFYMMENRQKPKKAASTYQDRARRIKVDKSGQTRLNDEITVNYVVNGKSYERTMRLFEYMNDFSTYVVVKGRVTMNLTNDDAGQNLGAEATYLIPLGNWTSTIDATGPGDGNDTYGKIDDYNIIRNWSYTYTVTVNSVNNIRVEVETSNNGSKAETENQPGAYGDVTVAKEEIAICDCHYVSKTLNFHLKNFFKKGVIDPAYDQSDSLTWSVKTPFGEGEPRNEGGIDITDGLDYKWVHFRLNKKDSNGVFTTARRKYINRPFESKSKPQTNLEGDGVTEGLAGRHNDGIMDVQQLVKYMKEQVTYYLDAPESSDFDSDTDPKISVTVFVDEYYYDKNPLTDEASPTLWKTFVNADDRKLHILCNSSLSNDLESRATGSVITIQQHSIQSIFNTDASNTGLTTAWGVEDTDEFEKSLREKDSSSGLYTKSPYWSSTSTANRGNTDAFNGLLNTAKEWELCDASGTTFKTGSEWGTYMEIEVDNDTPQFKDAYSYLRYSCMSRNRDNNGDGKIDRDELRWYMASIQQLIGLFVGKNVLNHSTQLYNRTAEQQAESDVVYWQQHVVSSTQYGSNSNDPTIVWAEEGISTSQNNKNWNYMQDYETVRCVRNLGYLDGKSDETYSLGATPQNYVEVTDGSGSKVYDASNLDSKALRYYTSKELPFHNETSIENQLYKKFEMQTTNTSYSDTSPFFKTFNAAVDDAVASGTSLCPDGYRIPNQTEAAVAFYFGGQTGNTYTRTFYSFGAQGSNVKATDKYGFTVVGNITVDNSDYSKPGQYRCVRDIRVD